MRLIRLFSLAVNADDSNNVAGVSLDRGNFSFSRGAVGAIFRF